jgi:hypothetical protein
MSEPTLGEEMEKFVQGLVDDADLRAWFESFDGVDEAARCHEFLSLAQRMEAAGEHPELIRSTRCLAEPSVYSSLREVLRARMFEQEKGSGFGGNGG